jgi:hypothetical protein
MVGVFNALIYPTIFDKSDDVQGNFRNIEKRFESLNVCRIIDNIQYYLD